MADPIKVKLVAREAGSAPKHVKIEDGEIVARYNGRYKPGDTFTWHWPKPDDLDGLDVDEQIALLPLWCDIVDNPDLEARANKVREDEKFVRRVRQKVQERRTVMSPGGFDPFRRHRKPKGAAAERPAVDADAPAANEPEPAYLPPEGVSGGKAGWFEVRVGDAVERVRGRDAAEAKLDEMRAAVTGDAAKESRAADMPV